MGSTRLPGKSLMPLAGEPLVVRMIERVKRCRRLDDVVLAAPDAAGDDALAGVAREAGAVVYRGSPHDLVERYYQAARELEANTVVRLPADNPVPEPDEIDRIVEFFHAGGVEFASNLAPVLGNGYPDGIGAEVFSFESLSDVRRTCHDPERREHPHLSFFNYKTQTATDPSRFRVGTVPCPEAFRRPDLVLDVNTREEYDFMAALYDYLYPRNPHFHITDIIQWYDSVHRAG